MSIEACDAFCKAIIYFFSRQLVKVTGGELRMVGGHPVDIYYVGKEYLHEYVEILEVFFKHSVFVEVAVTTVLVCIEDSRKTQVLIEPSIF